MAGGPTTWMGMRTSGTLAYSGGLREAEDIVAALNVWQCLYIPLPVCGRQEH